jgi:peptidoglycan/xylan/chitin deacetylase (PgdA/CDA1 family)
MNASGVHHPIDRPHGLVADASRAVRRLAKRTLTSRWVSKAWAPLIRDRVTFVMLHRFAEPDRGILGHDREDFRKVLEQLRRQRYALLSLEDAVQRLLDGKGFPTRSVVFTMDDGYQGSLEQCADLFQAYDCPLTIFVATGFLDGACWLWWDQIEHICVTSGRRALEQQWAPRTIRFDLSDRRNTILSLLRAAEWCKSLDDDEKWEFIRRLARTAEVELPQQPPAKYAPISWKELRSLEARGFSVGPHTVTHPILPKTSDERARWEISESWRRVRQELAHPLPVFAYPNGSYGARAVEIVSALGLRAAMTTRGAYASSLDVRNARFEIPRFGYPELPEMMLMITSGLRSIGLSRHVSKAS